MTESLRQPGACALTAIVLACVGLFGWPAAGSGMTAARGATVATSAFEQSVMSRVNSTRRAHGLRPLHTAKNLVRAAEAHARSMAHAGYFSHSSADGTSPATRIRRFYGGSTVGETLLWRSPNMTAAQAVQMWLNSPPHRAILLSGSFREIGLAAVHVARARGAFGGGPVTILVADFGAR